MKQIFITFLCCLLWAFHPLSAQTVKALADSLAQAHMKQPGHVGISFGWVAHAQPYSLYYGGKYCAQPQDLDSNALFEIGSVTKLYTAFLLASLEQQKKLHRHQLLSAFLPKKVTTGKAWANQIKLVDLATHTSGLPKFENTKSLKVFKQFNESDPYGMFNEELMLNVLRNTDTLDGYGEVQYSNFGVGVLAYAMASALRKPYDTLFTEYIARPLGLSRTFLTVPESEFAHVAIPHRGADAMPLIQLAGLKASGGIKTSMPELLSFLQAHVQPTAALKPVVASVLANQLVGRPQAVGLGWGIHTLQNETVYFHNGGTYGSSSIVILIPSKQAALAILANNSTEAELTGYALRMAERLMAAP